MIDELIDDISNYIRWLKKIKAIISQCICFPSGLNSLWTGLLNSISMTILTALQ